MADLYISDSTYAQYAAAYGAEDAKDHIRSVVKQNAPTAEADDE
jgi:hypothetical protein